MDYKNFDWSKVMWKPLWNANDDNGWGLIFDLKGRRVTSHPIVIMEVGDSILYLSSRSANWKNPILQDEPESDYAKWLLDTDRAVVVKESEAMSPYKSLEAQKGYKKPLFYNDTLIDTSVVFMMSKSDFLAKFDIDQKSWELTRTINALDRVKILESLKSNFNKDHISIIEVQVVENQIGKKSVISKNLLVDIGRFNKDYNYSLIPEEEEILNSKNRWYNNLANNVFEVVKRCLDRSKQELDDIEYTNVPDIQYYSTMIYPEVLDNNDIDIEFTDPEEWWKQDIKTECDKLCLSPFEQDYYKNNPDEFKDNFQTVFEKYEEYKREHRKEQEYTR